MKKAFGSFALVLHSHLPWLAHHGGWPVGEEWLYQSWAHSYLPVVELLETLAAEGRRDQLTLGVTPVLAAQLDDPHSLRGVHEWIGNWQLRAQLAATRWHGRWKAEPALQEVAAHEYRAATHALDLFESRWRHGFSPLLRGLVSSGVLELLGGPLAHPFQPLLQPRVRQYGLQAGLADTRRRIGSTPEGIWAPECGYAPGMEADYAAAGVRRFLVDGPALRGDTAAGRPVGSSDVVCFGRDLEVTYRVWSPKSGYPGDAAYRDFHTFDHPSGLKPFRVTGKSVPSDRKRPYEPGLAASTVDEHVADFVSTVVNRLRDISARQGKPGLVVAAYDTELFGHWWHEGPQWLAKVLRALPEAGVQVTTLDGAQRDGLVGEPVDLPASSWGSGKDWRVWDGEQVSDMVTANDELQTLLLRTVDAKRSTPGREPVLDQLLSEAIMALSSDWAFMVTKDSAAGYARSRATLHTRRHAELSRLILDGRPAEAATLAARYATTDRPFGHLDARHL
ncbi:glycoside hydrolase family 57 protein [Pseudonocardiaceae bacterium YIM PH 21723]|nr:glycoside hydrolase family 57 protein [Pseudonocardiaceae bacterium YIM PH 21723]